MHNDMDDLFRSGLEGKEDKPSPDVWAAIARGLPTPPTPATPAPSALPAAGGWASSIMIKGIIGAAVVAVVGTAIYFMTSRDKHAAQPEVPITPAESTALQPSLKTDKATGVASSEAGADIAPLRSKDSNTGTESPQKTSTETEKAEPRPPGIDHPDQGRVSEKETGAKVEVLRADATRSEIPDPGTGKNSRLSGVTKSSAPVGKMPSPSPRISGESFRMRTAGSDNRRTAPPVEKAQAPNTVTSSVTPAQAKVSNDHRMRSSDMKAIKPFLMPASQPVMGVNFPVKNSGVGSGSAMVQKSPAPLKRNDWRSRIYLTPMMSLNMTKMEVEENRSFGPRVGREHIEFRETEDTKTTLSPGLIAGFAITPRVSVQTGVSELRNDISVSPKQIKAVRDRDGKVRYRMDCSSGSYYLEPRSGTSPSVGDSLRIVSSDIKMRYVSIPLSVRVNVGNDKVRLFATAGADVNILAQKQTSTTFAGSSGEKISPVRSEGTRKQYLNGTLGAGVEIRAGKRVGIMLMPQYRFPLGNMNEEGPVLTYPKTFSLSSGVRIGF